MSNGLKQVTILFVLLIACLLFCPTLALAQGSFAPAEGGDPAAAAPPVEVGAPAVPAPAGGPEVSDLDLSEDAPRAIRYESPKVYTGERISLDFQNADLHNIIRIIGEVSGKNIVVSDDVSGKVTLKLKDVPWDQALDIVLSSRNLGVEESGNVLTIYDLPTLTSIQAGRDRVRAERAEAARLAPLSKKVFTPKYAPIGTVTAELQKILSARGKIVSIGNDIYVEDDPGTLATMTQIFLRIDKVTRQILIEARIIEASSDFTDNIGIQWGGNYKTTGMTGTPGEATGNIDINKGALGLGVGFLNKAQSLMLSAKINASESSSDTRTVSAPRIMAANDQEVFIKQGQQIPYYSGSSANTAANVEFKDVVMELRVKPHIEENGQIVTLDIKLTNDSLGSTAGSGGEPAINTREAETRLMVKDGETVVIGGIIVDTQGSGVARVPGLYRVPILGWLFQNESINNTKAEMLIFITANIIPINI